MGWRDRVRRAVNRADMWVPGGSQFFAWWIQWSGTCGATTRTTSVPTAPNPGDPRELGGRRTRPLGTPRPTERVGTFRPPRIANAAGPRPDNGANSSTSDMRPTGVSTQPAL